MKIPSVEKLVTTFRVTEAQARLAKRIARRHEKTSAHATDAGQESGQWITGVENVALAVARITGGHFFDPSTRRFFNARIAKAYLAPDGVLYVQHSTAEPRYGIPRLHSVTAFYANDPADGTVHHLAHKVSAATARRVFDRVRAMGCYA